MRIVKLVAENVKRLHAVEITPEGNLVTIGGKNGAGKSSVLDSIAYAMGGEKLVPSEPIRAGEAEAKIVVDLGDLVVTRRFKRERIVENAPAKDSALTINDGPPIDVKGFDIKWGETRSTLVVTNKDGARYPSPQAVLDKLLGRLTFDPLAFARDEPKRQDEVLRKLVGLDTSAIEDRRKLAFAERAMLRKSHDIKEAQLLGLPHHPDAPAEETPLTTARLKEAEDYRRLADDAEREVERQASLVAQAEQGVKNVDTEIARIERQIADLQTQLIDWAHNKTKATGAAEDTKKDLEAKQITAQAARAAVPDVEVISAEMAAAEAANAKVRANARRAEMQREVEALAAQVAVQADLVTKADEEKLLALQSAKFPVDGLGLSDDGVTFNGLPFAQAGSAEQVRVSVAIGIALNPKLQVLLIRNGNLLDDDSLAAVAAQAEAANLQIWMEYVTADGSEVSVMLEDGHITE